MLAPLFVSVGHREILPLRYSGAMVLVDSPSLNQSSSSRDSRRVVDPFHVKQGVVLSVPAGVTVDAERIRVLAGLSHLAQRRGRILAGLNPRSSDAERRHTHAHVDRVDTAIRRLLSESRHLVDVDAGFKSACASIVRSEENSARFLGLARSFYYHGLKSGETQGRVVDADRNEIEELRRIKRAITIEHFHAEVGSKTCLKDVLDAAHELGKRDGMVNRLQADVIASRVYRAIGGWREHIPLRFVKDAGAVRVALEGLSKSEAGIVQQSYADLTGRSLKVDLVEAFGSKRAGEFFLSLHAKDTVETALALKRELQSPFIRFGAKQEAVREIYQNLTPAEIQKVEHVLSRRLSPLGLGIQEYIESKVAPSIAKEIAAYRSGDEVRGRALQFDRALGSAGGKWRVADILRGLHPDQRGLFQEKFRQETGLEARAQLENHMKPSPLLDLCLAVLQGDGRRIRGSEIACALTYRREFIATRFLGLSQAERDALIQDYESTAAERVERGHSSALSGDFASDLRRAVWRSDYSLLSAFPGVCSALDRCWWPLTGSYPFVASAIRDGGLAPAELLRYFMVGLGTDVEGIYAVLSNRSQSEIRTIENDYAQRYPAGRIMRLLGRVPLIKKFVLRGDLRHDLTVELSGDSHFDVQQLLGGFANNLSPKQLCTHVFASLDLRKQHETSGLFAKWSRLAAIRGDSLIKRRYDHDFAAAKEYYEKHIARVPDPAVQCVVRFLFLARLAEIQANAFRETKTRLGELLLNSGAVVGIVLTTAAVLSLASFSYPIAASASFVGSLTWRLAMGRCILGHGFGKGEMLFQLARAFIDGVTIFTVRTGLVTLGQFIGGQLSKSAAKGGFKTGFNTMIKKMESRVRRQDKARHVLEGRAVIRSNEDLRSSVREYLAGLGDVSWPIGRGQDQMFPPIPTEG